MRLIKKVVLFLFLLLLLFVANVLISTGFFRTIEPKFEGKILKKIPLAGAEDITIDTKDSIAIISSTHRAVKPQSKKQINGLYLLDLKSNDYQAIHLTAQFDKPFAPHGISLLNKDSSIRVMAINHANDRHSIEVFKLENENQLKHTETLTDKLMISPNDLVMIDESRFYFTNDHKYDSGLGKLAEDYLGLTVSNVVYFDGEKYRIVADGIGYANGINIDRKRNLMFVASPRKFLVKVYSIESDGDLSFIENIPCGTGVDNIEFDNLGNLWIGCHPNLLRFNAYAKGKKKIAPSELIKIEYRKKGDYSIEQIYVEEGNDMSASTVAAPFGNLILTGNVMDDSFLILEQ